MRALLLRLLGDEDATAMTEFVICRGYKGYMVKEYFSNYALHQADLTIDLSGIAPGLYRGRLYARGMPSGGDWTIVEMLGVELTVT